MNKDNLHELINRYEQNIDMLYNEEHDELFKWKAMKTWREEWSKPRTASDDFAKRFVAAKNDFSLFMDNSRMHPSNGVLDLCKKEPETVEHLFREVLFAEDGGDVSVAQNHMDRFLEEYETLRQKHFPAKWSYKQDRHSASVFLAMNKPDYHFAYKASEAQMMEKYVDYGLSIGTGTTFSLPNYYRLCEEIVAALKEHDSLLEKHFSRLTPEHYRDESLHLLAFDVMYCCRAYNLYQGLTAPLTGKTIRKKAAPALSQEELERTEAERKAKIAALEQEIDDLERSCDEFAEISLIGVQVTAKQYGIGTVVAQNINRIKVRFGENEVSYILDKKHLWRPHFEDDETVISAFTEYGQTQEQIKRLQSELKALQK